MRIIFVRLGKSNTGKPAFDKRNMVTAAAIAVASVDHPGTESFQVAIGLLFDKTCKLSRRRVILTTDAATRGSFLFRLTRRHAFAKDADLVSELRFLVRRDAADYIVGEHSLDIRLRLFRFLGVIRGSEQALLFTRDGHEDDGRVEFSLRHHACQLDRNRRARRIVIRPRSIALRIRRRRTHRIVMARYNINPSRISRALEHSKDVGQRNGLGNTVGLWLHKSLLLDIETTTAIGTDLLKFGIDPIPRRPDPTRRIVLLRQRIPSAKRDELPNVSLDPFGRNFANHLSDVGIWGCSSGGCDLCDREKGKYKTESKSSDRLCVHLDRFLQYCAESNVTENRSCCK